MTTNNYYQNKPGNTARNNMSKFSNESSDKSDKSVKSNNTLVSAPLKNWFLTNTDSDIKFDSLSDDKIIISMIYDDITHLIEISYPKNYPKNKKGYKVIELESDKTKLIFIQKVNNQLIDKTLTIEKVLTHLSTTFKRYKESNEKKPKIVFDTNADNDLSVWDTVNTFNTHNVDLEIIDRILQEHNETTPVIETVPVTETVSVVESVTETVPVVEPVAETVSVVEPVADTVPVVEPVADTVPVVEPVADTVPVVEPVAETVSVVEPVAETVPVVEPVTETVPVVEPVTETVPVSVSEIVTVSETVIVTETVPVAETATVSDAETDEEELSGTTTRSTEESEESDSESERESSESDSRSRSPVKKRVRESSDSPRHRSPIRYRARSSSVSVSPPRRKPPVKSRAMDSSDSSDSEPRRRIPAPKGPAPKKGPAPMKRPVPKGKVRAIYPSDSSDSSDSEKPQKRRIRASSESSDELLRSSGSSESPPRRGVSAKKCESDSDESEEDPRPRSIPAKGKKCESESNDSEEDPRPRSIPAKGKAPMKKSPSLNTENMQKPTNLPPVKILFNDVRDKMGFYLNLSEYTKTFNFPYDVDKLVQTALNNQTQMTTDKISKINPNLNPKRLINMLINEIKYLHREGSKNNFELSIIDNNIYHLRLKFFRDFFGCKSKIYSELVSSDVQLEINLDHGLYPFYPPAIWIMQPRLKNQLNKSISHMDILSPKNWSPTYNLETFMKCFRQLMTDSAEIDMPFRSYTKLENDLLKLAMLSENVQITAQNIGTGKSGKPAKPALISGIGYGYEGLESWDFNTASKTKDEINREIIKCVKDITFSLAKLIMSDQSDPNINPVDIIAQSCFISYLKTVFKENNILELTKNITYFDIHLDSMRIMTKKFIELFYMPDAVNESLFNVLTDLNLDCVSYLNKMKNNTDSSVSGELATVSNFINYYGQMQKIISKLEEEKERLVMETQISLHKKSIEEIYKSELRSELFKESDQTDINDFAYLLGKTNEKTTTEFSNRTASARISKEIVIIQKSLPLYFESSIFYRFNPNNLKLHEFLITGPEGTPYDSGCFHFRLYCPANYPNTGPSAQTCTTGNGGVKFNPNLYSNGHICLSLLGTFGGLASEQWIPKESSMLQIMISIQSLVFNSTPYFNEHGHELYRGKSDSEARSIEYNKETRLQCMKWAMIDQIQNPTKGFEEAIKKHFTIKAEYIKMVCEQWIKESSDYMRPSYNVQYKKLCTELDKLTGVDSTKKKTKAKSTAKSTMKKIPKPTPKPLSKAGTKQAVKKTMPKKS